MGVFERSWAITKMSFEVLRKDSEMVLFPILASITSMIFALAMLFPTVFAAMLEQSAAGVEFGPLQMIATFATYLGLSFIATFFNVCAVYTTRVRLSGGDATFGQSIGFAFSRIHLILGWSLVSATVGLLLRLIDHAAERVGGIGEILLSIVRGLMGAVWSAITIFVVPAMVYRDLGPIDAIRDSVETLKRTWGESLVRHYGMGLAAFLCLIPCFVVFFASFFLLSSGLPPALGIAMLGLSLLSIIFVSLLFGLLNTIYNTALYHFTQTGSAPAGFDQSVLVGTFGPRG